VRWFERNFEEYEENRRAQLGEEADQPQRVKFKRSVR
jgi:energy-dependent translational throttle protein EttA